MASLSFCLLLVFLGLALCSPVPFLIWSGDAHFVGQTVSKGAANHDQVECLLYGLAKHRHGCKNHVLSDKLASSFPTPEVLVAVVFDKLAPSDLSLASGAYGGKNEIEEIKKFVTQSPSISVDYFYPTQPISAMLHTVHSSIARRSNWMSLSLKSDLSLQSQFENEEKPTAFTNGVVDFVIISASDVNDLALLEEKLPAFLNFIRLNTDNYVALVSADSSSIRMPKSSELNSNQETVFAAELFAATTKITASSNSSVTGPQYISSPILFGLLVSGFLLFILVIGVNIVMSIESPIRFPRRHLVVKKEY